MAKEIIVGNMESSKYDPNNKQKEVAFNNEVVKLSGDQTIGGNKTFDGNLTVTGNILGGVMGPEGFLINGKIVTSVNSGNLEVAIKTLAGTDPSTTDPVYCRIDGVVRVITSALSVTVNAGGAWFNAGSNELATKEIDYFVYLCYSSTNNNVQIAFARIPNGNIWGDFNSSGDNEKFITSNWLATFVSTDPVVNIGRFNAILSDSGSGYQWSILATSVIINRPIFETRRLYQTATVGDGTNFATLTVNYISYSLNGNTVTITQDIFIDNKGSCNGTVRSYLPFNVDGTISFSGSMKGGKGGIGTPTCYANFIVFNNSETSFSELQWSDVTNGDRFIIFGSYTI